jgi:hypothetical protein
VSFKKSLKVTIEHKGSIHRQQGKDVWFAERFDDFSSVAYWYQTEPHSKLDPLPPLKDRLLFDPELTHEAELQNPPPEKSEGQIQLQDRPTWSKWKQMLFKPAGDKATIGFDITVKETGNYHIGVLATRTPDSGRYQVKIGSENLEPVMELYDETVSYPLYGLGVRELAAGTHRFQFVLKGKRAASDGYNLGIDAILLKRVTPVK